MGWLHGAVSIRKGGVLLEIKEQAVIRWSILHQVWEVHVGIAILYAHSDLRRCKNWCNDSDISIRNQEEINRVLYENMPVQEMWS